VRIDYEYIKSILDIFLESKKPTVDLNTFRSLHEANEDNFIFHVEICADKGLITGAFKDRSIGISLGHDGYYCSVVPWRLTADGHDFAAALNKPSIMGILKEKLKAESLSVVISVTKKLAERLVEDQVFERIGKIT